MKKMAFVLFTALFAVELMAQSVLQGTVKMESGQPLSGANVWIKELKKGSVTDSSGNFSIFGLPLSGVVQLQVSFLGYKTEKILIDLSSVQPLEIVMQEQPIMGQEVIISATRAKENTPVSFTTVSSEKIQSNYSGQEIPMLLQITPSLVATSDAGTGIGYSVLRIRGTDLTRINVMVNDIPLNDAESHGVWWVNMPDFTENVNSFQVQRGVGTSTNGAAAFGASINLNTNALIEDAYAEVTNVAGSFNTRKHTLKAGTGLLANNTSFEIRLSQIKSDGFIDRADADLKSFYFSGGYYTDKHILRTNIFWGKEKTYQAWEGVPKVRLMNDTVGMIRFAVDAGYSSEETQNLLNSSARTFNRYIYPNQTDNYWQNHYQVFYTYKHNPNISANIAFHLTEGYGYYESYRYNKKLSKFGLPNMQIGDTLIRRTDLINRKFLDNLFYGVVASSVWNYNRLETILGGGVNRYDGDHFGTIIWSQFNNGTIRPDHEYYRNNGLKDDGNVYLRANYDLTNSFSLYGDIQWRAIQYRIKGIDDDQRDITQEHNYLFFNPKFGLFYQREKFSGYVSFARSHREPARTNFTDADSIHGTPKHEQLNNVEAGMRYKTEKLELGLNFYNMQYDNQLVLTGNINDVGNPIMENVKDSYRRGLEIQIDLKILNNLELTGFSTFSSNKINNFVFYVDDWDAWGQRIDTLKETTIAFSPSVIAGMQILWNPVKSFSITLTDHFVGKQYIDNSSSSERQLDSYWVTNLRFSYRKLFSRYNVSLFFQINNLYNKEYITNAWVYPYYSGGELRTLDGYFPQAGRNFTAGITLRF